MSRGYGKVERQILAVLDADQGATLCFSLESLVYAVSGYIANLRDDYTPPEFRHRVCDCQPQHEPGIGMVVYHEKSCYPGPLPPTLRQMSAINRVVRSLERKGRLKSVIEGRRLVTGYGTAYPARVKYLWRAETPVDQLCAWVESQKDWRGRLEFPQLWWLKCCPYRTDNA